MHRTIAPRLILVSTVGLLMILAPTSQGADPFVAGGRSTRPVAMDRATSHRALSRAGAVGRALGLAAAEQRVERFDDRFDHRVYDEVLSLDARGREIALTRLDPDGNLVAAMRLGWQPGHGGMVDGQGAAVSAIDLARAAGVAVRGTPEVRQSNGAGGWSVAWRRSVNGVPVRGDGVRVTLWTDGSFHAITRQERPLAAAPGRQVGADEARATAVRLAAARFAGSAGALRAIGVEQAWVAPNDTWQPGRPDAPDAVLRLAWVVRLETTGAVAERIRMVEFWLDAEDGSVIGGDVLE
jgi:hypothetical protein